VGAPPPVVPPAVWAVPVGAPPAMAALGSPPALAGPAPVPVAVPVATPAVVVPAVVAPAVGLPVGSPPVSALVPVAVPALGSPPVPPASAGAPSPPWRMRPSLWRALQTRSVVGPLSVWILVFLTKIAAQEWGCAKSNYRLEGTGLIMSFLEHFLLKQTD
jgi:hypothetical protein